MTPLPVFPADWPMLPARRTWLEANAYTPVPYAPEQAAKAQAILLVTPLRVGDDYIQPDGVWARYFSTFKPEVKLIQAGIQDRAIGPNYLHWSSLPSDFGLFLQGAQTAGAGWAPPDFGEKKLEVIWQRFWDGHSKEGFANWLSAAMRPLQIADDKLRENRNYELRARNYLAEPEKQEAFENLHFRWKCYRSYLLLAPFFDQIEECDRLLQSIEQGWADCKDYRSLSARLHAHRQNIERLDELLTALSPHFKADTP